MTAQPMTPEAQAALIKLGESAVALAEIQETTDVSAQAKALAHHSKLVRDYRRAVLAEAGQL